MASEKLHRCRGAESRSRPLRSPLRRQRSYAVIFLEPPNPDALRKKTEDQGRHFRLKPVANSYARRRIRLINDFANVSRHQIGLRSILHIAFYCVPRFGDVAFIARILTRAPGDSLVEIGTNISRLKIDNAHL